MADSIVVLTDNVSTVVSSIDVANSTIVESIDINTSTVVVSIDPVISVVTSINIEPSVLITSGIQGPPGVNGNEVVLTFSSNATISEQVLDTFSYTSYGGAKYVVYATVGSNRQICEILLLHDSVNVTIVEYANIITSNILCTFNGIISGANLHLLITPTNISTNFKITRTLLPS